MTWSLLLYNSGSNLGPFLKVVVSPKFFFYKFIYIMGRWENEFRCIEMPKKAKKAKKRWKKGLFLMAIFLSTILCFSARKSIFLIYHDMRRQFLSLHVFSPCRFGRFGTFGSIFWLFVPELWPFLWRTCLTRQWIYLKFFLFCMWNDFSYQ